MYKGSHPTTRRIHACHLCSAVEKKLIQPPKSNAPVFKESEPKKVPRKVARPGTHSGPAAKRPRLDVFRDQYGGRVQLIAPVRAAVEQARALIKRKRACKRRKGCRQVGSRAPRRRVYNPKGTARKSKTRRYRRHGRK